VQRGVNANKPILNFHSFYLLSYLFNFAVVFNLDHVVLNSQSLDLLLLLMVHLIFFEIKLLHVLVKTLIGVRKRRLHNHHIINLLVVLLLFTLVPELQSLLLNRLSTLVCIRSCSVGRYVS